MFEEMHGMRRRFRVLDLVPKTISSRASELFPDIVINYPLLIEAIRLRRGLGVKVPRDIVFAHLGLADLTREEERDLRVDYTIPISKLYTCLAMNIIHATGDLWILSHVERIDMTLRRAGLPSWVPDWSSPASEDPNYIPEEMPMFFDKGNNEGRQYALLGNGSVLSFQGYQIDVVEDISPTTVQQEEWLSYNWDTRNMTTRTSMRIAFFRGLNDRKDLVPSTTKPDMGRCGLLEKFGDTSFP